MLLGVTSWDGSVPRGSHVMARVCYVESSVSLRNTESGYKLWLFHFIAPKDAHKTFGKPVFLDDVRAEVEACTSGVAVADISATSKIEISVSRFFFKSLILCFKTGLLVRCILTNDPSSSSGSFCCKLATVFMFQ